MSDGHRRPIDASVRSGPEEPEQEGPGVEPDRFRDALSCWATGVTVVAVRDGAAVRATTVTAFASVSVEPPLVLVSLGPGAQVLPFLVEGVRVGVSLLTGGQRRLASVFADAFPVGPSPFTERGDPLVEGALAGLACTVESRVDRGDHRIVFLRVDRVELGPDEEGPLLHFRRGYRGLG